MREGPDDYQHHDPIGVDASTAQRSGKIPSPPPRSTGNHLPRSIDRGDDAFRPQESDSEDDGGVESSEGSCSCSSSRSTSISSSGSCTGGEVDTVDGEVPPVAFARDLVEQAAQLAAAARLSFNGSISVEKSKNVQFGNNTHYHGPVTLLVANGNVAKKREKEHGEDDGITVKVAALEAGELVEPPPPLPHKIAVATHVGTLRSQSARNNQQQDGSQKGPDVGPLHKSTLMQRWNPPRSAVIVAASVLCGGLFSCIIFTIGFNMDWGSRGQDPDPAPAPQPSPATPPPSGPSGRPIFVTREEWGALPPAGKANPLDTPVHIVLIHHTATPGCSTVPACVMRTLNIQSFHIGTSRYIDIGYNFLLGGDGSVYEGRGWDQEGAFLRLWNKKAIGVAFIGNFLAVMPSPGQMRAAHSLIQWGVSLGKIHPDYKLVSACQLSGTESPGRALHEDLRTWDHWWNYTIADQAVCS